VIPKRAHALLSDLHALLANYEAGDFVDAACFSPELATALTILSAKTGLSEKAISPQATVSNTTRGSERSQSKERRPKFSTPQDVTDLLNRTEYVESAASIIALGKKLGISVSTNPKDGKARLLRRLSNAIASLPKERRAQILSEIVKGSSSQTQGWIDVLKGRG
jgi:hypothetical protein